MSEVKQLNDNVNFDTDHSDEYDPISIDMISYIRHELGLTQQQFADKYHIPLSTLSQWEQHKRMPPVYVVQMIHDLWKAESEIKDLKEQYNHCGLPLHELLNELYDNLCRSVPDTFEDIDEDGNVVECAIDNTYGLPIVIEGVGAGFSDDERFKMYMDAEVEHYETVRTLCGRVIQITLVETSHAPRKIMDEETMNQFVESINRVEISTHAGIYLKAVRVVLTSLGYDEDWVNTTLCDALYDRYLCK